MGRKVKEGNYMRRCKKCGDLWVLRRPTRPCTQYVCPECRKNKIYRDREYKK